jgi:formylglycine-generating enzyme required for sulfatase activity
MAKDLLMINRIPPAVVMLLLSGFFVSAQANPSKQDDSVPAELTWITSFTNKVQKNLQGYWEVELIKGIVMVYIPAGEFKMGSPNSEYGRDLDEGPVHRVFTKGIWIGKYEITRAIWQAVMGGDAVRPEEQDLPQGNVSYQDIQSFLRALKKVSGLNFRLPTEAEWEKCCRSGTQSSQYGSLDEIAWYAGNSGGKTHPVGTKSPNNFGLFDMLGNVWEWCSDWYGSAYYRASPYLNPTGPSRGKRRVCRGGGFLHGESYLRSGHRNNQDPAKSKSHIGFRLVLDSTL